MNFLTMYDLFIFDLDGVIYAGNQLLYNADKVIKKLLDNEKKVYFLTNNSTKSREQFNDKLKNFGIFSTIDYIFTSAYATSLYLDLHYKNEKTAYVIGQDGLKIELKKFKFKIIETYVENFSVNFVIIGLDKFFNYEKLSNAYHYLLNGAKFIATNDDPSLPTENLPLPGAGSMVKALETCSGNPPLITIGKPNSMMINLILKKETIERSKTLMIGDRLSTDILAGINAKVHTLLVKTGSGNEELQSKKFLRIKPDYILNSIVEIL